MRCAICDDGSLIVPRGCRAGKTRIANNYRSTIPCQQACLGFRAGGRNVGVGQGLVEYYLVGGANPTERCCVRIAAKNTEVTRAGATLRSSIQDTYGQDII